MKKEKLAHWTIMSFFFFNRSWYPTQLEYSSQLRWSKSPCMLLLLLKWPSTQSIWTQQQGFQTPICICPRIHCTRKDNFSTELKSSSLFETYLGCLLTGSSSLCPDIKTSSSSSDTLLSSPPSSSSSSSSTLLFLFEQVVVMAVFEYQHMVVVERVVVVVVTPKKRNRGSRVLKQNWLQLDFFKIQNVNRLLALRRNSTNVQMKRVSN